MINHTNMTSMWNRNFRYFPFSFFSSKLLFYFLIIRSKYMVWSVNSIFQNPHNSEWVSLDFSTWTRSALVLIGEECPSENDRLHLWHPYFLKSSSWSGFGFVFKEKSRIVFTLSLFKKDNLGFWKEIGSCQHHLLPAAHRAAVDAVLLNLRELLSRSLSFKTNQGTSYHSQF